MKDNSNKPPEKPIQITIDRKKWKENWKKSHDKVMQNLSEGKRPDHDQIEQEVQKEVQKRLQSGEILINEQSIREDIIKNRDAIIDGLVQKILIRNQQEDAIMKEKLISEQIDNAQGIVSLNDIEQTVQAQIDQKNSEFNSKIQSIAKFINEQKQDLQNNPEE